MHIMCVTLKTEIMDSKQTKKQLLEPLAELWRAVKNSQPAGFEPARGDPIGFRVQRLNHSATVALL